MTCCQAVRSFVKEQRPSGPWSISCSTRTSHIPMAHALQVPYASLLQVVTNGLYALIPLFGIYGNPLDPNYWWVLRVDTVTALLASLVPVYAQLLPMQEVNVTILSHGPGPTRAELQRRRLSARRIGCLAFAFALCAVFMLFVVVQLFFTDCSQRPRLSSPAEHCTWWQHPLFEYPACSCQFLRIRPDKVEGNNCSAWLPDKEVERPPGLGPLRPWSGTLP